MTSSPRFNCSCNHCVHCTRRKRESMRLLRVEASPWRQSLYHFVATYLGYPRRSPILEPGRFELER